SYGVSVDIWYLNLIAEIMTCQRGCTPFNHQGMKASVSPFLKIIFETTCNFLTEARGMVDFDNLTSPSLRIILGKLSSMRSGSLTYKLRGLRG
ncbi:hypothetical protein L873DRAFT_1697219, partial [Choiromyces venosus 120613-1]